jgi:putative DNA primase/helicase
MHPLLELLEAVKPSGQYQWLARCPAHADREPSLSIRVSEGRVLLHCHAGCSVENILETLGLTMRDLYRHDVSRGHHHVYQKPKPTLDKAQREKLERLWKAAKPLTGKDTASSYLAARGVSLETYPTMLRFLPYLEYWDKDVLLSLFPALIARVDHPHYGLVALHRTYLHNDGKRKAELEPSRKLTRPIFEGATRGAAIRLFEATERLAVSEGIETALAVYKATRWPVWSCVSAVGLEHVIIPEAVREVIICADHDRAGKGAANSLARRLLREGKHVRVAVPPLEGMDWLDVLNHAAVLS